MAALGCVLAFGAVPAAGCGDSRENADAGADGAAASSGMGANGGTGGASGGGDAGGEGNKGGASCGFSACGGELDGVWDAREACVTGLDTALAPGCEDAMTNSAAIEGSYTFFEETGQLLTELTLTSFVTLDVDDECATALAGTPATAEDACPQLQARYEADSAFVSTACSLEGDVCHCVLEAPPFTQNVLNEYATSGTRIIDGQGDEVPYCVTRDELSLEFQSGDFLLSLFFDRR